jgi:hypothetical protein
MEMKHDLFLDNTTRPSLAKGAIGTAPFALLGPGQSMVSLSFIGQGSACAAII